MYKRIISPGIFFVLQNFDFQDDWGGGRGGGGGKGQKMAKKFYLVSLHFSGTVHHMTDFWYTCVK